MFDTFEGPCNEEVMVIFLVTNGGFRKASSSTYAIFASGQAQIMAFGRSNCFELSKIYFNVFPETNVVPFTFDPRLFSGQSLKENFFPARNPVGWS